MSHLSADQLGADVARELVAMARHTDDLMDNNEMEADHQYLLEDMTRRLNSLAARLQGEPVPEYRYAYPMEGEN
jgi:hypothetical protein